MKIANQLCRMLIMNTCLMVLFGCVKNDKDTVILPVPSDGKVSENAVPIEIREKFSQYINLYEGTTPPDITGYYISSPNTTVYCSDEWGYSPGEVISDSKLHFGEQTSHGTISIYEEKQGTSESVAYNVKITGHGSYFTVYFTSFNHKSDGVTTSKKSTVISGEMTSKGIKNFQYAFIMLEKNDPNGVLMPVNAYRVFKDGDGVASRINSFAPARRQSDKLIDMNKCSDASQKPN